MNPDKFVYITAYSVQPPAIHSRSLPLISFSNFMDPPLYKKNQTKATEVIRRLLYSHICIILKISKKMKF